jgi:hypothetical protein
MMSNYPPGVTESDDWFSAAGDEDEDEPGPVKGQVMFGYGDTVTVIPYDQIGRIVGDADRAGWLPVVLESEQYRSNPAVVWCKPDELR